MLCPYCNFECDAGDRYCSHCGASLTAAPQVEKGRHWVPILAMALIFVFGTVLFFAAPGASTGVSPDRMPWFQIDGGILSFSVEDYDGSSELVIPESIGGITVTALAEGCFENCTSLTGIILPATLQAIGEDAFRGCTALRGIEIPESVVIIGEGAFSGCTALEAVSIYDGIKSIGAGTFSGCSKLFYIFFSGYLQDWDQLYSEYINPYTTVFSQDGTFYHGEMPQE